MEIEIAFSPCPNDTFIFDAMVNGKIDTGGIRFKPVLMDVQALNECAIEERYPITKISYGAYPAVSENYVILDSGSALGSGVGPLLISSEKINELNPEETIVAIPGETTTAHVLFNAAFPNWKNKIFLRYDLIEDFVKAHKGIGVIIHENRFTYAERGLNKISDLGEVWERNKSMPIPLGGIIASRKLNHSFSKKIESLISESIRYAQKNDDKLPDFVKSNAQEMSEDVMRKHIDLYVNEYSISLSEHGRNAIEVFLQHCKTEWKNNKQNIFL